MCVGWRRLSTESAGDGEKRLQVYNRGYFENLDSPWIRLRSLFSKMFDGLSFRMDPMNVPAKFEVHTP